MSRKKRKLASEKPIREDNTWEMSKEGWPHDDVFLRGAVDARSVAGRDRSTTGSGCSVAQGPELACGGVVDARIGPARRKSEDAGRAHERLDDGAGRWLVCAQPRP